MTVRRSSLLMLSISLSSFTILSGCSSNNVPAGSDASKLPVSTTPESQLQADSARHNQMKNYYRKEALASRRSTAP